MSLDCSTLGREHDWAVKETHFDDDHYRDGTMRFRSCSLCQLTQYIVHTAKDGTVIDIEGPLRATGLRDPTLPR